MKQRKRKAADLLLAAMVALTACGQAAPAELPAEGTKELVSAEVPKAQRPPVQKQEEKTVSVVELTLDEAVAAAVKELGLTDHTLAERELDRGVYELELWEGGVEYEVDVNAFTGAVTKIDRESERYGSAAVVEKPAAELTLDEAVAAAVKELGLTDYTLTDWELDDGVYELELWQDGMEYQIDIHASTGAVLELEQEREKNKYD